MPARQETRTHSDVELTPLSETTWRVCDARFDSGDTRGVVGYLQEIDGGFEMLWMRPRPGVVYRYGAIDEAVAAIAVRLDLTSDLR